MDEGERKATFAQGNKLERNMKGEVEVCASCWPVCKRPRAFLIESEETVCDIVKDLVVFSLSVASLDLTSPVLCTEVFRF